MGWFRRNRDPLEELLKQNPDMVHIATNLVGVYLSRYKRCVVLYGDYTEYSDEDINYLLSQQLYATL